jgi:hypothetical protein
VTVVTRENDSDDDMSEDDFDDDEDDADDDAQEGARTGIPFRRAAEEAAADDVAPTPQASSTPYNPSKSHQVSALHKAKLALKAKDKMHRKGIKGGHAYKKPKITSKKKKIKFGNRKGANRDR